MKRSARMILAAVSALALTSCCTITATATSADEAYCAYYNFLQDQINGIGQPATDVPAEELTQYTVPVNWVNERVNYAQLTDFNNDGIPELIFGKNLEGTNVVGGSIINCVYTYQNGQMVRLAGGLPVESEFLGLDQSGAELYRFQTTLASGTDGYTYMVWEIDGYGTDRGTDYYYTLKDGRWQEVAGFGMDFDPDIYISQDVFTSTGDMHYFYTDANGQKVELPHADWYARLQAMSCNGKVTCELGDTLNNTMATLAQYVEKYNTPSPWAAAAVQEGIDRGIVPEQLQKSYTTPITRAEFCALACAFYEDVLGEEIIARMQFVDTNDECVEKMGGLGVIQGVGNGYFSPDSPLTREAAAVILNNLSHVMGKDLPASEPDFADSDSISSWARGQVGAMQVAGIMSGVDGGRFAPHDPYTREQSIVTIFRIESNLN